MRDLFLLRGGWTGGVLPCRGGGGGLRPTVRVAGDTVEKSGGPYLVETGGGPWKGTGGGVGVVFWVRTRGADLIGGGGDYFEA